MNNGFLIEVLIIVMLGCIAGELVWRTRNIEGFSGFFLYALIVSSACCLAIFSINAIKLA